MSLLNLEPRLKPLALLTEQPSELLTHFDDLAVALARIESDGVLQLAVADAAVVEGPRLTLPDVVAPVHPALVVDAVADAEHVPDLMRHHLACTVQHQVFSLFWGTYFIPIEFG